MIWGVWEVGFDFWALTPRSDILVFFGIWLICLLSGVVCRSHRRRGRRSGRCPADQRRHPDLGRF
jgi:glucose dehydrogenase